MTDAWAIAPEFPQLALGGLVVSFQRFVLPDDGVIADGPPSSLGALPVARVGERFMLPVAAGEGFWIGLSVEAGEGVRLHFAPLAERGRAEEELIVAPDTALLPGWRRVGDERLLAFARVGAAALSALRFTALERQAVALVELVDYADFTERSGQLAPEGIDPEAGYKGYRLP